MATIELDSSKTRNGASPPISLHPAFPAVVAMWFAALLGVGSLVLPGVLLEKAIEAIGLVALVPAAALPLGLAGRSLIAVALAIAGALAGAAIARRLARAHGARPWIEDAGFASGPRRPISVNEEIGGYGLPIPPGHMPTWAEDDLPAASPCMAPLPAGDDGHSPALDEHIVIRSPRAAPVSPAAPREDGREPLRFCPPSLARRAQPAVLAGPQTAATAAPAARPFRSRDRSGLPVGERGLAQLVERLRASVEQRRETLDAPATVGAARFHGSPAKTGAALREALATLQRLRGVA